MKIKPNLIINLVGTALGIIGAALNAAGNNLAFPIWMISNTLLFILFFGVWQKRWELNSGALVQCGLYIVYFCTSSYGFLRVG